jgi:phosphorylcholine metabolism protein LicD
MNILQLFSTLWTLIVQAGMPFVFCYHLFCNNVFLNTEAEDATGLEKAANTTLAPVHYLLAGRVAHRIEHDEIFYEFEQQYDYHKNFIAKSTASFVAFPFSLIAGSALKAISYLSPVVRERHAKLAKSLASKKIISHHEYYQSIGIKVENYPLGQPIDPPQHIRRPGEENILAVEKEALKEIARLLKENHILFWADCGTCLGAYRYGGIIPWDFDIDLAVLEPDFDNVKRALNGLDKEKYDVQDWSGRNFPKTYLKVHVKETGGLIDIYHFRIHPEKKMISSIFSNEDSLFMSEAWKIRERRYTVPTPFDVVFPLKMAQFDGIEIPVPNQIVKYLQGRYGENIGPVKIYNETTGQYEKDESHPYWQRPFEK